MKSPYKHIAFIGLGLIGGSLAKLIRKNFPETKLYAIATKKDTISFAVSEGIVDNGSTEIDLLPADVDLIFVCTPISKIAGYVNSLSVNLAQELTITDIGSIKSDVCDEVFLTKSQHLFIPGHPMAGNEKLGIRNSEEDLLKKAPYILVPQENPKYETFKAFISNLDFKVIELSPKKHDEITCIASHFPYLMACLTVSATENIPDKNQDSLKEIISSGFRDTTRVASCSSDWGAEVIVANKENMLEAIMVTKRNLEYIEKLINNNDTTKLQRLFENIKKLRKRLT
jgi:prephenate dehydrogenase